MTKNRPATPAIFVNMTEAQIEETIRRANAYPALVSCVKAWAILGNEPARALLRSLGEIE